MVDLGNPTARTQVAKTLGQSLTAPVAAKTGNIDPPNKFREYGVRVRPCPPRRGNRKGVVEKANHTAAQRWWRSLPDDVTAAQAQALLDRFCERVTDQRSESDRTGTVAPSLISPPPSGSARSRRARPSRSSPSTRKATAQALVHYRGNRYSLPPELAGATVTVTHRAGGTTLAIVTGNGVTVAVHPRRADGTGATERTDTHVTALNTAAMAASSSAAPHRSKQRIPPGPDARAAAAALRATNNPSAERWSAGGAGDRPGPVRPGRRIPPHPALTDGTQPRPGRNPPH